MRRPRPGVLAPVVVTGTAAALVLILGVLAGGKSAAALALTSAQEDRLAEVTRWYIQHRLDDPSVREARAVRTTFGAFEALEQTRSYSTAPAEPVFAVTVSFRRRVTDYGASIPSGGSLPTGIGVLILLRARNYELLEWGIGDGTLPLRELGPVELLDLA